MADSVNLVQASSPNDALVQPVIRVESTGDIPDSSLRTTRSGTSRRSVRIRLIFAALLLGFSLVVGWTWQTTPSVSDLPRWVQLQDTARHAPYTSLSAIAPDMLWAIIAAEDARFYQHHGIDTIAILRAMWTDLRAGRFVEGGSTITAQLAKNAYLGGHDHTIQLKADDLVLSMKIEQHYTKDQILEMYLNLVYYGEGAYGIGAASARYFGTTPSHLDLAQSAVLAGLAQAPGYYDPYCHPAAAHIRQQEVLARMVQVGYITDTQRVIASREVFAFWRPGTTQPPDAYCPK